MAVSAVCEETIAINTAELERYFIERPGAMACGKICQKT